MNAGDTSVNAFASALLIRKAAHFPAVRRLLQLAQRPGFDLPDALTRHIELLSELLSGAIGIHTDT